MSNILFTYAMVNWLKPFPHEMSHPTFINLFTRIMVKWLNGRVYTRNAQHGRTHYHGEREGREKGQLSPRAEFENSAMRNEATIKVFSPAAVNKHASHKFHPDRCYLLLNQIFLDPSFVQIHRVPHAVYAFSLFLFVYLSISISLSLSA